MNVCQSLICFFFLTLQDGNIGLINAEIIERTGTEGGNITVGCSFTFSGRRRIFCKDECKDGDILIDTEEITAQRGRYSIEYKKTSTFSPILYVSITNLTQSDSGRYRCSLDRFLSPDGNINFEIRVTDAPTSPLRPSSPSVPSASTLMTSQSLSSIPSSASTLMTSQSLSSTPSSASPEASEQPPQKHTAPAAPAAHTPRALLYVGLTLVLFFIMLSVALLIFCRKRAWKPKEPPLETEYAIVTDANRVYEEIREDRQSTSPPVEVSTVYTYVKYTKPDGVETTEEYSLVTAPTSQKKTEDNWSDLTYSELDLPNGTAALAAQRPLW
ncbi:hypothetical protein PFLUV_G00053110 [Perca fluviatilis]|uniref:Immunoglobulin subtype domain-containing protein n=1 Tax=Perca fluviatilis TaxID=8168 RepID=A0A6A5F8L2_PERFL|nr:CMRF35-like molecule 9 [Perca fluviatilis]KAF1389960.1 hypothetical protein PFLUV_G00053110 [Perca fluviatilis]